MRRVNDLALLPPAPLDVAGPDCGMEAGDLVAENTLRTAVILSLFLDRRTMMTFCPTAAMIGAAGGQTPWHP